MIKQCGHWQAKDWYSDFGSELKESSSPSYGIGEQWTEFQSWTSKAALKSHHNCRQGCLKLLLQSIQILQADLRAWHGAYLYLSSTQVTSVSPLLSTPVYRGHSGASISFNSKGQSFSSTDSLLPLTCSDNSHKVFHGRQDSRKFTLPGFPPPFPLVGVGTRLFLCFVISLLFATIYCWHQLIRRWFRLCNRLEANYHPENLTSSLI